VSATGKAEPPASEATVHEVAIIDSAAIEIGTNEKPMPIAISRNPGRRSPRYEPPTDTCVK
jgi:hypothetical protein